MNANNLLALILLVLTACGDTKPTETEQLQSKTESLEPTLVSDAVESVAEQAVAITQAKIIDQNEVFDRFKETFLEKMWELNPDLAVYVGYYKHDDQLLAPSGELRARRRAFLVNELMALKEFDANQLSAGNATDLAIIEGKLRRDIWYIDVFRGYEWNPAGYNPAGVIGVILNTDYKPIEQRMSTISTRLAAVPEYYQAAIQNLKVPTLEHTGLAIQQTKGTLSLLQTKIPAKVVEANLIDAKQATLNTHLSAATKAVEDYLAWLEKTQQQLRDEGNARSFRIGAELYEKKFKHDIASSYSARELYDLALVAKERLHADMISITKEIWPNYFKDTPLPKDDLVAVKQMIDHLSSRHVKRDEFVDEIRRQMPIIQKFMDDNELLDSDPSRPLIVRLTPEYQRGFAGASVNAPGPYDATANTYYNVSPLDAFTDEQAESYLREYNHWILQILNIHEATPGHYTQLMHANKSPSKIKSIFGNGAMIEGWAVYSERMMLEAGYGDNEPEMWLMYSKWNLRVVVNTILDYRVQVLGMERDQALDLLMNEAFQEQAEAEGKWRRATVSQVQLTSYFTGYSEIYSFREELKKLMGDKFDLKTFHNTFLSYGSAPVPVIKSLMMSEIATTAPSIGENENGEPDASKVR